MPQLDLHVAAMRRASAACGRPSSHTMNVESARTHSVTVSTDTHRETVSTGPQWFSAMSMQEEQTASENPGADVWRLKTGSRWQIVRKVKHSLPDGLIMWQLFGHDRYHRFSSLLSQ